MSVYSLDDIERMQFKPRFTPFSFPYVQMRKTHSFTPLTGIKTVLSLNGRYEMACDGDETARLNPLFAWSDSIPAEIPCTVQTALFNAGKIGDPMFAKNDKDAREAAYHIWWFKKEFSYDGQMDNPFLSFHGICHEATVWLNGHKLGSHLGMFGGPDFSVKGILKANNTLIVKIENSPTDRKKYSDYADFDEGWKHGVVVNCVYGWHYACIPTRGIWQDVLLIDQPVFQVEKPFLATEDYQNGSMSLYLKTNGYAKGIIKLSVHPQNFEGKSQYYESTFDVDNIEHLHYKFNINDPKLWWPNGYGEQYLYKIDIMIIPENQPIQHFEDTIGIRQIEMLPENDMPNEERYNWRFCINGKYIFIKGTNWCTLDALMRFPEERYDRFLTLAKHQNLQLLRAWGGGMPESDYFYRKCDELGLLVQQEWPTCWDSPKTQPAKALTETVKLHTIRLRNHASLVRWAGGNELSEVEEPSMMEMGRLAYELDGTRPFHRTSPYAGSLHSYGTYWEMEEMDHALNLRAAFIGEFGMASSPNKESVYRYLPDEEKNIWDPEAKNAFNYHTPRFNEFRWPEEYNDMDHLLMRSKEFGEIQTLEDFIQNTQLAQAVGIRHTIEGQRADFPKACGVCYYKLTDVYPACSWATVDYYGVPKIPYYVIKNACEPTHIMAKINSIDAVEDYPIYLLDDCLTLKGKTITAEIRALNSDLNTIAQIKLEHTVQENVQEIGLFHLDSAQKEQLCILSLSLYCDGECIDSTFYLQNYRKAGRQIKDYKKASGITLKTEENQAIIENTGSTPAVGLFLEALDRDTTFTCDDNFLLMLPGEKRKIPVNISDGLSIRGLNF